MKRTSAVLFAILAICFTLGVDTAQVQAQTECTTQGALALGLAELLKLNVTSADAAVAALAAIGVEPDGGWKPGECLTPEVIAQVKAAYAGAVAGGRSGSLVAGAVDDALVALKPIDRKYDISPSRP